MAADKVTEALIEALKQARAEPAEQRLYKSGKLPGLFSTRGGPSAQAADLAVRDGLLEVVRTETKGKVVTEWVRLTPRGVDYLHSRESPTAVLQELRALLQTSREGVPVWLADLQRELATLSERLTADTQRMLHHLDTLSQRVEEALRRADATGPLLPNGLAESVPWAIDALTYLDRRRDWATGGVPGHCPLPELFAALCRERPDLSVTSFHDGLRRLYDRRAVHLLPFTGPPSELPEPEYALLDGATVLYYVTR
jgi:hypothetical protein